MPDGVQRITGDYSTLLKLWSQPLFYFQMCCLCWCRYNSPFGLSMQILAWKFSLYPWQGNWKQFSFLGNITKHYNQFPRDPNKLGQQMILTFPGCHTDPLSDNVILIGLGERGAESSSNPFVLCAFSLWFKRWVFCRFRSLPPWLNFLGCYVTRHVRMSLLVKGTCGCALSIPPQSRKGNVGVILFLYIHIVFYMAC